MAGGGPTPTLGSADAHAAFEKALSDYASNDAFRSAEGFELLFTDNPFHRPVRPNDLSFVDFSRPLEASRLSELSALMGQRMLCNANEADIAYLPRRALPDRAQRDRMLFYAHASRLRAESLRPFLETYLFAWLEAAPAEPARGIEQLLNASLSPCVQAAVGAIGCAGRGPDAWRMGRFVLAQLTGPGFSRELAIGRWTCVDWRGQASSWIDRCAAAARAAQARLLGMAGLAATQAAPHALWQFYLGPWLGASNYLHRCIRDPLRFDEAIGAVLFDRLCWAQVGPAWSDWLGDTLSESVAHTALSPCPPSDGEAFLQQALAVLEARAALHGPTVLGDASHGIVGMQRLWQAAFDDLTTQCDWANTLEHCRLIATRYMTLIAASDVPVDLESYDEPSSERSTTHVHDTDRLLVIDEGEMDFWHSLGAPVHFRPGDMIFVPRNRLHGSVVTSERCRYHQPIIDERLAQAYRQRWG